MELKCSLNFGIFFSSIAEIDETSALSFFSKALSISQALLDNDDKNQWKFQVLGYQGKMLMRLKRYNEAVKDCFDEQLRIAYDLGDEILVSQAQYNLGEAYYLLGDYKLARSTIMNCIDNIKIRCSDKSQIKDAEDLLKRIFQNHQANTEAEKLIASIPKLRNDHKVSEKIAYFLELSMLLESVGRAEASSVYLGMGLDLLNSLPVQDDGLDLRTKCFKHATNLFDAIGQIEEALFYSRKWLELVGENSKAELDCMASIVNIQVKAGKIDQPLLELALKAEGISRQLDQDEMLHMELLGNLVIIHEKLGLMASMMKYKDECIGLNVALQTLKIEQATKDYDDIESISYFGDRKITKTIKSLMGGDFQMRTKTNKAGAIVNRRQPKGSKDSLSAAIPKKRAPRKVIESSESDLSDFIVEDEENYVVDENRPSKEKKVAKRVVYSSSDTEENPEAVTINNLIENNLSQTFEETRIDDYYDFDGPVESVHEEEPITPRPEPSATFNNVLTYMPRAIRISVQVLDQTFVVPCFDDDITNRKTIRWLAQEAEKRYAEINEKEPIIKSLHTIESNAILAFNDPVSSVLTDGQTIVANLLGWKKRSLLEEYLYQCVRLKQEPLESLKDVFEAAVTSDGQFSLDFSGLKFTDASIECLSATLRARLNDYERVSIDCSCTVDFPFEGIAADLEGKLVALDVSFCKATPNLLAAIKSCASSIESLNLSFLYGDFAELLMDAIKALVQSEQCKLKSLSTNGYDLEAKPSVSFESIHYLGKLEELSLEASTFSTEQLLSVGDLLTKSHSIKALSLHLGKDLQPAIPEFAARLRKNFFLKTLALVGSDPDCVQALKTALAGRDLQIHVY